MKLKLDENLGRRCIEMLRARGHDVATVVEQSMISASDADLIAACRAEQRALISLDLDFSNPLIYSPKNYYGIAVLRLSAKASYDDLLATMNTLVDALEREELVGKLWSVEVGRVRVYQPLNEPSQQIDTILLPIAKLWTSLSESKWKAALNEYWKRIPDTAPPLESELNQGILEQIRQLDAISLYDFLHDKYFKWKYTAANRLATTRTQLQKYKTQNRLDELEKIRLQLLAVDFTDVRRSLMIASNIYGLGTAGASGLLALMYPSHFGTVDQFVVKGLREIYALPEADQLAAMNEVNLTINDAVLLIDILRRKAQELNRQFSTDFWTPRRIDMILWAVRSETP